MTSGALASGLTGAKEETRICFGTGDTIAPKDDRDCTVSEQTRTSVQA